MTKVCEKMMTSILTAYCAYNSKIRSELTIEEVARICKNNHLEFKGCIQCLYENFETTTADEMAKVALKVWYGVISCDLLKAALECSILEERRAYSDTEINNAIAANISLTLDSYYSEDGALDKIISLCEGDLTGTKPSEHTDFLIISALPGDYSPTKGSMVRALSNKGISISMESTKKAADYREDLDCWITGQISGVTGVECDYILVFEPQNPKTSALGKVENIFKAIKRFIPEPQMPISINSSLLCTNSGGVSGEDILKGLFNASKACLKDEAYPINMFRISMFKVNYAALITVFENLKGR